MLKSAQENGTVDKTVYSPRYNNSIILNRRVKYKEKYKLQLSIKFKKMGQIYYYILYNMLYIIRYIARVVNLPATATITHKTKMD